MGKNMGGKNWPAKYYSLFRRLFILAGIEKEINVAAVYYYFRAISFILFPLRLPENKSRGKYY